MGAVAEDERNEFLSDGGTGVLSFARVRGRVADVVTGVVRLLRGQWRLLLSALVSAGSSKADLVERPVSFVVHGETDAGWRSVVATGTLEELAELPEESAAVQRMWAVSIPTVDMFDRPRDEIPFHDFRLVPETISGRKEAV